MRSTPPLEATQSSLILLVDDNPHGMLARAAVLTSLGYEVITAASAEEALEVAGTRALDLVVTDFRMPEMDGKQLIDALRARGFEMPVILLSGFADKRLVVRARTVTLFDRWSRIAPAPPWRTRLRFAARIPLPCAKCVHTPTTREASTA